MNQVLQFRGTHILSCDTYTFMGRLHFCGTHILACDAYSFMGRLHFRGTHILSCDAYSFMGSRTRLEELGLQRILSCSAFYLSFIHFTWK